MASQLMVDIILRHPKERKSKCSVEPVRHRPDIHLLQWHPSLSLDASNCIQLHPEAPLLQPADCPEKPFLLLDSTWRLVPSLLGAVCGDPLLRSLPPVLTAYPRHSKIAEDPPSGLATIEALVLARCLRGDPDFSLLDAYHWRIPFLENLRKAGFC